jgi:hypothetical protein
MDLRNPFGGRIPPNFGDYGRTPTNAPAGTPAPSGWTALQGRRAWYRLAYAAMLVRGLPEQVRIGGAVIMQTVSVWACGPSGSLSEFDAGAAA